MEESKWFLFFWLIAFQLNFVINEEEGVDEIYDVDLAHRGRTHISTRQNIAHTLKKCHLAPGKNVELDFTLPEDVRADYGDIIFGNVSELVPGFLKASDTTYKLVALENSDKFLSDLSVGIYCGFMENVDMIPPTLNLLGPFMVDIPSSKTDINSHLMGILHRIFSRNRVSICGEKPDGFTIQLRTPQGSRMDYEHILFETLKRQLEALSPCKLRFAINRKILQRVDKTLIKIEYLINVFRSTSQDFRNLIIDLTQVGVNYSKALHRLSSQYIWTKSKDSCRLMNIIVKLSQGISRQFIENLVQITKNTIFGAKPRPEFRTLRPSANNNNLNFQIGCGGHQEPNVLNGMSIIDLSLPGVTLVSIIQSTITNSMPRIQAELDTKGSATISFIIKAPPNQRQSYVAKAENELKMILQKYFGDCDINVEYQSTTNRVGILTDMRFDVSLRRLAIRPGSGGSISIDNSIFLSVDLTKIGTNNIFEIRAKLIELLARIRTNTEISFTLSINIPKKSDLEYLQTLQDNLMAQLSAYFPHYTIQMTSKASPTTVNFEVRLAPSVSQTTEGTLIINLLNPAVDLINELNDLILKLLPRSLEVLDRRIPFSFSVMLIPPQLSTLQFVNWATDKITEIINRHFPNYNPLINVHSKVNLQGNVVNTIFEVQIHPKRKNEPAPIIQDWKTNSVDLAKPVESLEFEIKSLLQNLLPGCTNELNRGLSVGLRFEIKPVPNSKREHLKIISTMIIPIVINTFPNHRVDTRQSDVQDDEGIIKKGAIEIILQPKKRNDELKNVLHPLFILNLFHSKTSLDSEVLKIIPQMFKKIGDISNKEKSHTFEFVITPPLHSRENYAHGISHVIVDYIFKYFPDYSMEFFSNGLGDIKENIISIKLKVTLVPGKSPLERGILAAELPNTFNIQVPSNTKHFIFTVGEWMQSNILRLLVNLEKEPVVLKISVVPYKNIRKADEVPMLEELKELILNLFPHCNIRFGISAIEDWKVFVTHMIFEVSIERNPDIRSLQFEIIPWETTTTIPPLLSTTGIIGWETTVKPPTMNTIPPLPSTTEIIPWETTAKPPTMNTIPPLPSTTEIIPWETTAKPPTLNTIPSTNFVMKLEDDLEVLVLPKLSEHMIDIISILKSGNPCAVPYIIKFPNGTNRKHIQDMEQILINIFENHFPNYLVHSILDVEESYGNDIKSVAIEMSIRPPKQEVISIDLTYPGVNILETFRPPFSTIESSIKQNLMDDNKVGIMLNIKKPKQQPPKFVLDIIRTLNVLLEEMFSGLEFHIDVDTNDANYIRFMITLKSNVSQNASGNDATDLIITVSESGKSPTQRLDDTLNSIYSTLKPFVDEGRKVVLILNMNLNSGLNEMYIEKITDHLRSVLEQMIPNAAISITPYVSRGPNNTSYIKLHITLELYTVSGTTQVESLTLDLSHPQLTINSEIKQMLPNMIAVIQRYSTQQRSVILNLHILPPSRSTDFFLQTVISILVPLLASPFCNYGINWKASTSTDLEGFLKDIVLSFILEPSGNSSETMQCQRNIDIDLRRLGASLDKEIDQTLQRQYAELQSILSEGKTQTLNFKFLPPPRQNKDYMNYLSQSSIAIVQNYFPYNNVGIRIKADQTPEGYLSTILLIITILPETNPLPKSDINIRIDNSLGGSLSLYVKTSIHPYMSQIQALMAQNLPVAISFVISPRRGAADSYLQEISSELLDIMQDLFPHKMIQVQSKVAKNSKKELFRIMMVVTITPNN